MTRFFIGFFLITFIVSLTATAQVMKPVQFSFSADRNQNEKAYVTIKAKVSRGVELFSATRKSPDEVFLTSIEFDSAAKKFLKDGLAETGHVKASVDSATGGVPVRFFRDSVEWQQELQLDKQDSATIKGTVTWLARQGDSFPGGEESFSIKVKPTFSQTGSSTVITNNSLWSNFWLCLLAGLL